MKRRIAVLQMVSSMDVESNLATVSNMVVQAASENVQAIFLPENFAALANANPRLIGMAEEKSTGPIRICLSRLSRMSECWIFAGTLPTTTRPDGSKVAPPQVRAASFVYDEHGHEVGRYDKMHMFDVDVADNHKHYLESETFEAGEDLLCMDSPIEPIGLSVCYDIRFPELYRKLFSLGARSLSIPSAFTEVTGKAHFEVLMRSRAIENFCFTIAACQGGEHDSGRKTYGHSMVVSPWGEILAQATVGENIIVAELDFDRQDEIRSNMPIHLQRKLPM
ncbi:MAG: carbon-nitrogen hydrolase family protein [Gammaproteobacteria bacterium]|nr:carbon-nitrogen hydrolase family protein [Gammaproteobacteria bacterium]